MGLFPLDFEGEFEIAVGCDAHLASPDGSTRVELPAGPGAVTVHHGPRETIALSWFGLNAIYPVTLSRQPQATAAFYTDLLGTDTTFAADWYVSLGRHDGPQVATVQRDHDTVPEAFRQPPAGVLVTVEVDDATAVYDRARTLGARIVMELRDEEFGQRHFMTVDPDGLLVDVVEPIPPSPEFAAQYADAKGTAAGGE